MMILFLLCITGWQQYVVYDIDVSLDTEKHQLSGTENFTYYNNSPEILETLYLHLYANAYRDENSVYMREVEFLPFTQKQELSDDERGWITINSVSRNNRQLPYQCNGTLLSIPLPRSLLPGDSTSITIDFVLKIPRQISRLGYSGNDHYEVVQWYPKLCVFDEHGWHLQTYHALGEFYGEFGNFNVKIELPGDFIVAATGQRVNEEDIDIIQGLIQKDERPVIQERRTVEFHAEKVHDFAWVCDPDYMISQFKVDGVDINIFYLKSHEREWRKAGDYVCDAIARYNKWYMEYPYQQLSVVDGTFRGGMEYPQLVIIGQGEDPFTRLFETIVVHEIAHQWFYGLLGSDEMNEAWLDEGFTTFSEIRYFEDKYGKDNSLLKIPFIPSLPRRYYHQLIYYISQTNGLEKPVLSPAYDHLDAPLAYVNGAYSKPALFLFSLQNIVGAQTFDKILRRYVTEYAFTHPSSEDFIKICEEETNISVRPLLTKFLTSDAFSDWRIKAVQRSKVEIENRGDLLIPVEVLVEAEHGARVFYCSGKEQCYTFTLPVEAGKIKRVVIDPYGCILEPDRWNNYYPRQVSLRPIFHWPSFDSHQILYLPYLWYSSFNGLTIGLYLFSDEFADFDMVKGRHQVIFGGTYGTKSDRFYLTMQYQTPLLFERGKRTRLRFGISNDDDEDRIYAGVLTSFGTPLSYSPKIDLNHTVSYYKLRSFALVDSVDWQIGTNVVFENTFSYKKDDFIIYGGADASHEIFGGDYSYLRMVGSISKDLRIILPFKVRVFAGRILGQAPFQEQLFLSGALRAGTISHLLFGQTGYFSPQEHIHISGGGNMLGYQTLHLKSDRMACVNLEFPATFPIRIFTDFGYYGEYAFDIGLRLTWAGLGLNLPLYIARDEPWALRWSVDL